MFSDIRKTYLPIGGKVCLFGRSGETRTRGLMLPKHARYQLRYTPIKALLLYNKPGCESSKFKSCLPAYKRYRGLAPPMTTWNARKMADGF